MTSAPSGSRIAFKHEPTGSSSYVYWYIDDITVEKIGSCMKPRTLECTTYSEHTATLAWTAGADGQEDFDIVISNVALADPSTGTIHALTNLEQLTYNATGLSTQTTYYAYVRANCGESQSLWEKTTFTTACGAVDLTYSYGFEDESALDCWTLNNCHSNTKITTGYPNSGSKKFTFNNDSSKNPQTLITPELNTNEDGVSVELYYRASSGGGTPKLKIAYSTTDNNVASFDWTNCIEVTANTTSYNKLACDFQVNGINYIAIQFDRNGSSYHIYIDDIRISDIPAVNLPYEYGFEDALEMDKWRMQNCYSTTGIKDVSHTGSYGFGFVYSGSNATQYLITPLLKGTSNGALISLYKKVASTNGNLQFGYSTGDNVISSFTFGSVISETDSDFKYYEFYCPANTKYICIRYNGSSYTNSTLYIDDIRIVTFDKVSNGLNWYNTADWNPTGVPSATDNVYIQHDMTIPNECVATANDITIGKSGSLTIAEGGQLICNNAVQATVEKNIIGVGQDNWEAPSGADGWYFIASPVNGAAFPTGSVATQDIYQLDWANSQWLNLQKDAHNSLLDAGFQRGTGYLYASKAGNTLSVAGEIQPLSGSDNATVTLATTGWNLIGNPLTCKVTVDKAFSELNNASSVTNQDAGAAINPFQGIAVYGTAGDVVTFTKATSQNAVAPSNNALQMTLSQTVASRGTISSEVVDNAIVKFNGNSSLPKFSMLEGKAKLYIPQNGEDYAIVSSEAQGEMPVNFKANEDGQYTLTVNAENVEMNYLHLIDNMTGADIDLMANPSYTFDANATDYASRFRIVFSGNGVEENLNESDNFAFIGSDGQLVVSGTGTIQILDMMGRVISTKSIEENISTNGMTPGVYVLRLIGNETKTQKIVVR